MRSLILLFMLGKCDRFLLLWEIVDRVGRRLEEAIICRGFHCDREVR
jgi:hypothetical protein